MTDQDIKEHAILLKNFIRNPIVGMKNLPDWSYQKLLVIYTLIAVVSGALAGIISLNFFGFLSGIILLPIISLITIGVSSLFFHYTFLIFLNREVPFRQLLTVIAFANIPFFIFQTLSGIVPPISLIAFAISAFLLIVGFVENFQMPRQFVVRMVGAMYILFFLVWAFSRVTAALG